MSTALVMSNSDVFFEHEHVGASPTSDRPHSIDLTLALERELESESLPTSPVRPGAGRPQSLDTNVLASIVTQLRMNLEEMTKERDSLRNQLAGTQFREENLQDALESVTDKCLRTEAELATAREQHKEDEEAIAMLRQKVEESRRALMRLQTESRRRSQIGNLDLSQPGSTPMNGPPSSKRASFAPLTASPGRPGHRRIVSLSDPGFTSAPVHGEDSQWATSPGFTSPDPLQAMRSPPLVSGQSKRMSGMFGWGSSQLPDLPSFDIAETEVLRKELERVKEQLEETKHELTEAHEAREASESCVRALRTFIAENSVGEQTARTNIRTATKPNTTSATSPQSATSRWGFKLWATPDTPANTPIPTPSPALTSLPAPSPVTRKLGGFFSPRSSVSSVSSPLRTPASATQDPPYQGSDTSSVADSTMEPVSPASSAPQASIHVVKDAESISLDSMSLAEPIKTVEVPL